MPSNSLSGRFCQTTCWLAQSLPNPPKLNHQKPLPKDPVQSSISEQKNEARSKKNILQKNEEKLYSTTGLSSIKLFRFQKIRFQQHLEPRSKLTNTKHTKIRAESRKRSEREGERERNSPIRGTVSRWGGSNYEQNRSQVNPRRRRRRRRWRRGIRRRHRRSHAPSEGFHQILIYY